MQKYNISESNVTRSLLAGQCTSKTMKTNKFNRDEVPVTSSACIPLECTLAYWKYGLPMHPIILSDKGSSIPKKHHSPSAFYATSFFLHGYYDSQLTLYALLKGYELRTVAYHNQPSHATHMNWCCCLWRQNKATDGIWEAISAFLGSAPFFHF